MTALLDFPTASILDVSALPVSGESALVPLTSLRLPLSPAAARIPVDQRCADCAGTGVMFGELDPDELHGAPYALVSCGCMWLPMAADRSRVAVVDYIEPDYR